MNAHSWWVVVVSSMEQIIGAALSTVVGVMLPMMQLTLHPEMPATEQGLLGAIGLIGIAFGSPIIGKLSDKQGYLKWFRICAVLIIIGALICWIFPNRYALFLGLFVAGFGVGGGYSLDSAYISELVPKCWRGRLVGLAKSTCAIGFIGAAWLCWIILKGDANPEIWHNIILIIAAMAALTLLMRIHWADSPKWLVAHGRVDDARKAWKVFFGKNSEMPDDLTTVQPEPAAPSWTSMFKGPNLRRVIYSGVPWACEGLGVYGFGVFLPILVMALGLEDASAVDMTRVIESVKVTTLVNFFILPGFILGMLLMNRMKTERLLCSGFIGSAIGLIVLYFGYILQLPKMVMIIGFIIFEVMLNAGPHLITYIIPAEIYPISERGTGNGIAAMLGKIGAILGVILMPILIHLGGAELVLIVSACVMIAGAVIGALSAPKTPQPANAESAAPNHRKSSHIVVDVSHSIVLILSVLLIVYISYDTFKNIPFLENHHYMTFQFWVCVAFLADFFIELILARDKKKYLKMRWLFFFISIPYLNIINIASITVSSEAMFFLRFVPLLRGAYSLAMVLGYISHNRAVSLMTQYLAILVVLIYSLSLIFFYEEYSVNTNVNSFWDALYWSAMNVTTVGCYFSAVTAVGKIISVILPCAGMMILPLFTVMITSKVQAFDQRRKNYNQIFEDKNNKNENTQPAQSPTTPPTE